MIYFRNLDKKKIKKLRERWVIREDYTGKKILFCPLTRQIILNKTKSITDVDSLLILRLS